MKFLYKLPLYLGLSVFVLTVLVSAIKVGERGGIVPNQSQATIAKAILTLRFSSPDFISVTLNSDKEVAGVDVTLNYDKDKLSILPSTLTGGPAFVTTGGNIEEATGEFSFSALAKEKSVTSGIVATFNISAKNKSEKIDATLQFIKGEGKTAVIDKTTGENILTRSDSLNISL